MKRPQLRDDQGVKMEDSSERSAQQNIQQRVPSPQAHGGANGASTVSWAQRPAQAVMHNGDLHSQRWRIALYSPGIVGLGHMRRNLLIAQTLAASPLQPVILMIAESREGGTFAMPPGMDCLTLPALRKGVDGQCTSRNLEVSLQELVALRSKTISATLGAFAPDVLIVDYLPRGVVMELDAALAALRARGRTRCVLGLRDVLDDPIAIQRAWSPVANEDTIREYYDMVWVYGDPTVYDPLQEYPFPPDVMAKVRYTGYLDQRLRLQFADLEGSDPLASLSLPPGRLMLCLVGGGQDGGRLAEAFAQADLPPETNGVIVTGPFMPPEVLRGLRQRVATHPRLRVLRFIPEPTLLLDRADRVIAMGGYNTVSEILSLEKRALIVPRMKAHPEQLIRAERLRDLGLLDVLPPDQLSPRALSEWLARDPGPLPRVRDQIDLNGLARLPGLLRDVLAGPLYPTQSQLQEGSL